MDLSRCLKNLVEKMKILKDITIQSYLDLLNSENKTFRKYYSDEMGLDSNEYRALFTEDELILDMLGIDDSTAPELEISSDPNKDFENSVKIYEWLGALSISDANDPRFWTTLTHVNYEKYTKARWKIDKNSTNESIKQRYFYNGGSLQARLRNSISRLWWIAKLTVREDIDDKYIYTRLVWASQDLMQNLFERALGTYPSVRFGLLNFLHQRKNIYDSKQFRIFYKEINALGALSPLGLLSEVEILEFLFKIEKFYFPNSTEILHDVNFQNTEGDNKYYKKSSFEHLNSAETNELSSKNKLIYLKRIIKQDLNRTPTLAVDAAKDFFKLKLKKGETYILNCQFNGKEINIEVNKRNTRDEFRFFINHFKDKIGYELNDILKFEVIGQIYKFELLQFKKQTRQDPKFEEYNKILNVKNHAIILESIVK
jgi:hypothetical protein